MNTTTGSFTDAHRTTNARTTEMYGHDLRTTNTLTGWTRDARADVRPPRLGRRRPRRRRQATPAPGCRAARHYCDGRAPGRDALVAAGQVIGGPAEDGCPEVATHRSSDVRISTSEPGLMTITDAKPSPASDGMDRRSNVTWRRTTLAGTERRPGRAAFQARHCSKGTSKTSATAGRPARAAMESNAARDVKSTFVASTTVVGPASARMRRSRWSRRNASSVAA